MPPFSPIAPAARYPLFLADETAMCMPQSRATLQPLFLYQGNDHAAPLRANLELSIN